MIEVDGFVEFYVHWYFSYSVKRAMKLKLRDRRTLPASLVSYAGTVLSLLWPNKFALVFCCLRQELANTKQWETLCGTLPQTVYGPQPQNGGKGKATAPVH